MAGTPSASRNLALTDATFAHHGSAIAQGPALPRQSPSQVTTTLTLRPITTAPGSVGQRGPGKCFSRSTLYGTSCDRAMQVTFREFRDRVYYPVMEATAVRAVCPWRQRHDRRGPVGGNDRYRSALEAAA
jgi:hypothetical protein